MPIIEYAAEAPASKYAGLIETELSELYAAGEGKATEFSVPSKDATGVRIAFGVAANKLGKTARVRVREDSSPIVDGKPNGTGTTRFVFTLSEKRATKGSAKDTELDVPTEEVESAKPRK